MAFFTTMLTAIGGALAITGTALSTFVAIGTFALKMVVGLGLSLVASMLAGKPKQQPFGVQGKLQGGADISRSILFGLACTAGSLVWANAWGQSGKTPNAYFTQVIQLADMPIQSITQFFVNNASTGLDGTPHASYGYPALAYRKDGKDHLWVKFYDGTQTTADSFLTGTASSTGSMPYDSNRVGWGCPYIVVTSLVNSELFTGFPTFKVAVTGMKLYDVSKDSTAGGSGTHRWDNPSTWGGDGDHLPAVQLYNILRGIYYQDEWLYGLQGMTAARLPAANWIAQINKCRATTTNLGGTGTEPMYRSGCEIQVGVPISEAIEALLTAMQGRLCEIGGSYKLYCGEPDSATFSFTDDDILSTTEQSFTPFYSLSDSINGIKASFPNPDEGWNAKVPTPIYREDYEERDGNRRLMADVKFNAVPYEAQVQRLMSSALQEAQRARRHTISFGPKYWFVEPGDIGAWTSTRNNYTAKLFRVDGAADKANLDVTLDLTEVDPDDFTPPSYGDVYNAPITPVRPASQSVGDFYAVGIIIDAWSTNPKAGIRLTWDGDDIDDVDGIQYEIRRFESTDVIYEAQSPRSTVALGRWDISENLVPHTTYQIRARFVSTSGRPTTWSSWLVVVTETLQTGYSMLEEGVRRLLDDITGFQTSSIWRRMDDIEARIGRLGSSTANADAENAKFIISSNDRAKALVYREQIARTTETSALASDMLLVQASITGINLDLDDPLTGLNALGMGLTSLTSRVDITEDDILVHTDQLTVVEGRIDHPDTGLIASSTGIINLWSSVGLVENKADDAQDDADAAYALASANAGLLITLQADVDGLSAGGIFKITASASPPTGATSGFQLLVKASDSGNYAEAGIEAYALAGGGATPTGYAVLIGDRIYRRPSAGGIPVLMVDNQGRFVGDALGSGIVNTFYEYTRAERGSDDQMGSGNTGPPTYASGAGNGFYVNAYDYVGSLTVPANPNAIGAGAPNSTYGAVLTTVNASVRNTGTGWGLGSAYPMVVAFRVRFDNNAGTVFYSEEGLIACNSGWAPSPGAIAYGFGGNPGTLQDIVPIAAGTYSVYLEYRWGPRTADGLVPTPSAPNGVPVRIQAKIVCLLLKR